MLLEEHSLVLYHLAGLKLLPKLLGGLRSCRRGRGGFHGGRSKAAPLSNASLKDTPVRRVIKGKRALGCSSTCKTTVCVGHMTGIGAGLGHGALILGNGCGPTTKQKYGRYYCASMGGPT